MGCIQKSVSSDPDKNQDLENQEKEDKSINDNEALYPTPPIQTDIIRNKETSDSTSRSRSRVDETHETVKEGKEKNPIISNTNTTLTKEKGKAKNQTRKKKSKPKKEKDSKRKSKRKTKPANKISKQKNDHDETKKKDICIVDVDSVSKKQNDNYKKRDEANDNELEIKRKKRKKKKKKNIKKNDYDDTNTNITDLQFETEEEKKENTTEGKTFPWSQWDIDIDHDHEIDIDRSERRFSIGSPREFKPKKKTPPNDIYSSDNELEIKRKKHKKKKKKHTKHSKKKKTSTRSRSRQKSNRSMDIGSDITDLEFEDLDIDDDDTHMTVNRLRRASIGSPREFKTKEIKKFKASIANEHDIYASDNELEIKRKRKRKKATQRSQRSQRREKKKRKLRAKHRTSSLPPINLDNYKYNKYNPQLLKNIRTESKRDLSTLFNEPEKRKKSKKLKNLSRNGFEIHINHRYALVDGRIGVCKYRGRTVFGKSSEDWIGLVIEVGDGEHNGSVKGKCYFRCRDGKGLFVRPYDIIKDMGSKNKLLDKNDIKLATQDIKRYEKKESGHMTTSSVVITSGDWGNEMSPDHGDDLWHEKSYNPKTLLDKNKGTKVDKKNRHFQV